MDLAKSLVADAPLVERGKAHLIPDARIRAYVENGWVTWGRSRLVPTASGLQAMWENRQGARVEQADAATGPDNS